MGGFHFLRPEWLAALLPLLLLLVWLHKSKKSQGVWQAVCDASLIPYVLAQGSMARRTRNLVVLGTSGALAILALAGPVWQELPQPVFRQQSALVVMLDLSKSMDAGDLKPSRLERARLKLMDLLRRRVEGQTALIAYAGDAFTVTPLTDDTDTIIALLQGLSTALMPVQGSRPDRAVQQSLALLSQAGIRAGSLLLITDGVDAGKISDLADTVAQTGHDLSVMGVGTAEGAPIPDSSGGFVKDASGQIVLPMLDERVLEQLAFQAGGVYTRLRIQDDDIDLLLRRLNSDWGGLNTESANLRTDRWREEGPWLLLLLLPVATLAFRKGLLVVVLCLGLNWSDPALALEWGDLWLNTNQRGVRALTREEYGAAAESFTVPQWKAVALYRQGEYEQAAEQLQGMKDPEATYNRGNALARLGRLEEAIQSYEQTLELQPEHEDARFNLDLLKQMQNQQKQQQSRQQSEQPSGENNQQQAGGQQNGPGESDGREGNHNEKQKENQDRAESSAPAGKKEPQQTNLTRSDTGSERPPAEQTEFSDEEPESARQIQAEPGPQQTAEQQAMEQWLRRVPDDPAGLLRRKFRYQYTQRYRGTEQEGQPW